MGCRLLLVVVIVVGMLVAVVLIVDEMEGRAGAHALAHQHAQGQVVARRSEKKKKGGKRKEKELSRRPADGWWHSRLGGVCDRQSRCVRVLLSMVFVQHNLRRVV